MTKIHKIATTAALLIIMQFRKDICKEQHAHE